MNTKTSKHFPFWLVHVTLKLQYMHPKCGAWINLYLIEIIRFTLRLHKKVLQDNKKVKLYLWTKARKDRGTAFRQNNSQLDLLLDNYK